MPFRFKYFSVEDTRSTQRIGTDAMLLGAWANPGQAACILDIGTGCGVLALMMAQKSDASIDALDIDEQSVAEASENFRISPWTDRLTAICTTLQSFNGKPGGYDFIITNPPFFTKALPSPDRRRNFARHDDCLPAHDLAFGIASLLSPGGRVAIVLPSNEASSFTETCHASGFFLMRRTMVRTRQCSGVKRVLMEFGKSQIDTITENDLTILGSGGEYSPDYLSLTAEFHNF